MKTELEEGGMSNDNDGDISSISGSRPKRPRRQKNRTEPASNDIVVVIQFVIDLCNNNSKNKRRVQLDTQLKVNLLVFV